MISYSKAPQFLSFVVVLVLILILSDKGNGRQTFVQEKHSDSKMSILAFPGAEGYGAYTKGGRGGKVLFVTNLKDYDPGNTNEKPIQGSLREAVETEGPRIVIFRISGIIELKAPLNISEPYLTLAGQTAPGDGICLKNYETRISQTHDIIVRYMRFRPGDEVGWNLAERGESWQTDALSVTASQDVIIDHCSTSWANDEVLSLTGVDLDRITVQWTMITESMNKSTHYKGPHGYGSIVGGHIGHGKEATITMHHNVYAHHDARNPHFAGDRDGLAPGSRTDFRNNVIYDWGRLASHNYTPQYTKVNYIANYLKPGSSTREEQKKIGLTSGSKNGHFYLTGNRLVGYPEADKNNWLMVNTTKGVTRLDEPLSAPPVITDDVEIAFQRVMEDCGATKPTWDAVDERIVEQIITGGGRIIDSQEDVGSWPTLYSLPAPMDSDNDGMPDYWEEQYGLNIDDPTDNIDDSDGDVYENIEEYINNTDPSGGNLAIVYIGASDSRANEEDGEPGEFTVYRIGNTDTPLSIGYTVTGTATAGDDYSALSGTVTIEANQASAKITIIPFQDAEDENTELVVLTLNAGENNYHVGCPNASLVAINQSPSSAAIEKNGNELTPEYFELK